MRRRTFLWTTSVGSAGLALGCDGVDPAADGSAPAPDAGGDAGPEVAFGWRELPAVVFTVGVPVELDLLPYVQGYPPGAPPAIALESSPPEGLTLEGGVLRGTPTVVAPARDFVATADDGATVARSAPFSMEVRAPSDLATLRFEVATPEQLGLYLPLGRVVSLETRATVRYRAAGDPDWREAHPLFRLNPEWVTDGAPEPVVDAFAGTIFDLAPGGTYEVEITIEGPDASETFRAVSSTRPLPPEAGAPTRTASPGDDLQALFDALAPGDVLELAEGVYDASGLHLEASGTREAPIVIRGASRRGTILSAASGRVLQVLEAAHLIVEDLTLRGSGSDSGTAASSVGVSFWNGAFQSHVTFRRLHVEGVDKGIIASGPTEGVLVYECALEGNNPWTAEFVESNLTWNDDGVRVPGQGNCVFQNTLTGFGDSLAVASGIHSAAVYFYRNRIARTGDDACEGDYATRNIGFYDNHVSNCATLLSLDPLWGGPLYCFRNVCVNTFRGPFKLNATNCGFAIYANTIVRTDGRSGWAWAQPNNGALRNWSYRNNVLYYQGDTGRLIAVESSGCDPIDFTHNAFFDDGAVWWTSSGGSYGSFEEARAGLPETTPVFGAETRRHAHDVLLPVDAFETPTPLGPDHRTEVTAPWVPRLAAGSVARGAGVAIPNVTDGFEGDAPDIGAVITGRPLPRWGAAD